jgi:RNA polymerase sigma-70 factor (ECF subfamily)
MKHQRMQRTTDDFITLLEPHYNSAVQYCRALFINRKDAEDGFQDAIIRAIQHFRSLRDDSKFRSWFFTIVTRTFYSSRRKQAGIFKLFTPLQENHQAFPEVYNEDHLEERERIMLAALDTIGEKERTAILLFEIGGLSLQEIRTVQKEKSISAVKSRLTRTRLKLRNTILEMEKQNQEEGGNYDIKTCISGK